jgi:hypothetical protein
MKIVADLTEPLKQDVKETTDFLIKSRYAVAVKLKLLTISKVLFTQQFCDQRSCPNYDTS